MIALFGIRPPKIYFEKYLNTVKHLIWKDAEKFLKSGQDVILDFGFSERSERDFYRNAAKEAGVVVKLYNLQCPEDKAIERVLARNIAMSANEFFIDKAAYHQLKLSFEPLDPETEENILILS